MNKGKIVIKLNNDRDGVSINSTWETPEDRKMIKDVLDSLIAKIEYVKISVGGNVEY